jgi:hypothetical protein
VLAPGSTPPPARPSTDPHDSLAPPRPSGFGTRRSASLQGNTTERVPPGKHDGACPSRETRRSVSLQGDTTERVPPGGRSARTILMRLPCEAPRGLEVVGGRAQVAGVELLKSLRPPILERTEAVAMEMSAASAAAAREAVPRAEVVPDRFHVSKLPGEAVDQVRPRSISCMARSGTPPAPSSAIRAPVSSARSVGSSSSPTRATAILAASSSKPSMGSSRAS